jgi:hypothetical protein
MMDVRGDRSLRDVQRAALSPLLAAYTNVGALLSCHACGVAAYHTEPIPMLAFVAIALSRVRRKLPGRFDGCADAQMQALTFLLDAPLNVSALPSAIRGEELIGVLTQLPQHSHLRRLEVTGVPAAVARGVLDAGGGFPALRLLECTAGDGVATLVEGLAALRAFAFDWDASVLPLTVLAALCGALGRCASLRRVVFAENKFGPAGLAHVAALIKASPSLQSIDLYDNAARDDGALRIAAAVRSGHALRTLSLRRNYIRAAGAAALAAALPYTAALTSLDVSENPIGDDGDVAFALHAFSDAIAKSRTLAVMEMDRCDLTDTHAVALAPGVSACRTLRCVSLTGNRIGDDGAVVLAAALTKSAVESVDFCGNNIGPTGKTALRSVMGRCIVRTTHPTHM